MKRLHASTAFALALALALPLPLAACGASGGEPKATESSYDSGYEGAYYDEAAVVEEREMAAASEEMATGGSGLVLDLTSESVPAAESDQKLVYTASVAIDTTDYQASVAALRDLMAQTGAFAQSEDEWVWSGDDCHVLEVTLRVPREGYETLMAGIDAVGTVTNRTAQVTNITRTYNDNEAVIEGLEIQEQRLLEMMGQADTVEEMLLVEDRLSEVQTQLNRARTSRETMDADVSLSTVEVRINEVRHETVTGGESYLTRVGRAFVEMWDGFVEGVGDFFIGLIYAIPAIVIVALAVLLGRKGVRRIRARRAERRDAAQPQVPAVPVMPVVPQQPASAETPASDETPAGPANTAE